MRTNSSMTIFFLFKRIVRSLTHFACLPLPSPSPVCTKCQQRTRTQFIPPLAASRSIIFLLASRIISSRLRCSMLCLASLVVAQPFSVPEPDAGAAPFALLLPDSAPASLSFSLPLSLVRTRACKLYLVIRSGSSLRSPRSSDATADARLSGFAIGTCGWNDGGA